MEKTSDNCEKEAEISGEVIMDQFLSKKDGLELIGLVKSLALNLEDHLEKQHGQNEKTSPRVYVHNIAVFAKDLEKRVMEK